MPGQTAQIRKRRNIVLWVSALLAATVGLNSSARAGFTTINPPPTSPVNEATFTQIFNHVYSGSFTLQGNGVDYSNGSITAVRIPDTGAGNDQIWSLAAQNITAKAVWAGDQQGFGYYPGASGGSFTPLFGTTGTETFSVTGSVSNPSLPSTFRWGSSTAVGSVSSLPSDNFDGQDHMVSYQITGLGGNTPTYMLFLEDRGDTGSNPDFDFQDLVVQLQATSAVPEPGTMMIVAGAAMLLLKRPRSKA